MKTIKLKIPKNKKFIQDLNPTFNEIETLQIDIKNADDLYKQYIKELCEEAIPTQKETETKIIIQEQQIEVIEEQPKIVNKKPSVTKKVTNDEEIETIPLIRRPVVKKQVIPRNIVKKKQ